MGTCACTIKKRHSGKRLQIHRFHQTCISGIHVRVSGSCRGRNLRVGRTRTTDRAELQEGRRERARAPSNRVTRSRRRLMLAGPDPGSAHVRAAYAATKGKATIVNEPHTQRSSKRAMPLSASQIRGWIRSSAPPTVNYAAICASTEHITALSKMRAVLARSMCEATDWFSAKRHQRRRLAFSRRVPRRVRGAALWRVH